MICRPSKTRRSQALENPEIAGIEYQHGEIAGYEVREARLEKWGRRCAYGDADGVPLEIEYICSRSRGGSDRFSNLTLACRPCNEWDRSRLDIPNGHALDAACVMAIERVTGWRQLVLLITAIGRGSYQRTRLDVYGFPRGHLARHKRVRGFATGDLVYVGRVVVRASGSFNVQTSSGTVHGISWKHCRLPHRGDGYIYSNGGGTSSSAAKAEVSAPKIG